MSIEPSSRVQILEYPASHPSKCVVCGASPNEGDPRKWIDISVELEEYGSIYFCTFCIAEVAGAISYVGPAVYLSALNDLEIAQSANRILANENEEFRRVFSTLRGFGALVSDGSGDVGDDSLSVPEDAPEPAESVVEPEPAEQGIDEPVRGKGSRHVPKPRRNTESDDDLSF